MTRKGDLAARYGGEEFAVVIPQTHPFGLKTLSDRLREAIAAEKIEVDGKPLSVTASFGGACITHFEAPTDAAALIKLADHYLYQAKKKGRNRSELYPKLEFPGRG
jgi:diguanylate cyclase (GGDEF)-like protein